MKIFNFTSDSTSENKIAIGSLIGVAIIVAFWAGHHVGQNESSAATWQTPAVDTTAVTEAQFAPFWKVWHLLDQKYVAAASTTGQQKIYGAIQGLASSEGDPYTVFFPPTANEEFQSDIAGNFQGVGMEIDVKNNVLTVIAPLKGSPSEKAGMRTGDIILKINGTSTENMTVDQAVHLIRGPKGSSVKLNVLRPSTPSASSASTASATTSVSGVTRAGTPFDVTIVRDVVNIPTLDTTVKGSGPSSVFVISLYSFTADSPNLFRNALRQFVQSGSHKLILDLRGNPGGYLEAAWDMASWFLPAGDIVVTEDYGKAAPAQVFRSKGYDVFNKNLDMEILVNGGSASAAEILAGALKEHGIAMLVGSKTFGKGSVQELIPITADTSLKVTVARWLTPSGHNLSHDGLDPDVAVTETDADIATHVDTVLNKAVDIMNSKP